MRPRNIGIIILTLPLIILGGILLWDTFLNRFDYSLQPVLTIAGNEVEPRDFITLNEDAESISIDFANRQNDLQPGRHEIDLRLSRRLRRENITAVLYILKPFEYVHVEFAQSGQTLTPLDFIANADIIRDEPFSLDFVNSLSEPESLPLGEIPIELVLNNRIFFRSIVSVADRTPPRAVINNRMLPMGEEITPDIFIEEIIDASPYTVSFINEPDIFRQGEQILEIEIVDAHNNIAVYEAVLYLLSNETPPEFVGLRDITVMRGTAIMFRQGVSAYDVFGRPLDFGIDSSRINVNELGVYTATYWAEDEWGLRTEVDITVTIIAIDPEEVRQRVDVILAEILSDGMTQVQQARAIYDWVVRNVEFAGGIGQDNVYEAAFQALQFRRGHCFVFYGISEVMLTQAGIPNMRIERIPGTPTRHRWNLINPDGLGWHHFDANQSFPGAEWFMFTSSRARWRAAIIAETVGIMDYYTYDPDLYPPIVQ